MLFAIAEAQTYENKTPIKPSILHEFSLEFCWIDPERMTIETVG